MKLYSRGQVIVFSILGGALTALMVMVVPKVVNVLPGLSGHVVIRKTVNEPQAVPSLDFVPSIDGSSHI